MQRYYSNVYWHFTGSPIGVDWKEISSPSELKGYNKKSINDSFNTMVEILISRKLLATSSERISSIEETDKFCCVCDIPLKDLKSHRECYGDVAIGFNHFTIQKEFNPVLYINKINAPLIDLDRKIDTETIIDKDATVFFEELFGLNKEGLGPLSNFIKQTKFGPNQGDSFYEEREWRHLGNFNFKCNEVEAIIIPKEYRNSLQEFLFNKGFINTTILTWELVERL